MLFFRDLIMCWNLFLKYGTINVEVRLTGLASLCYLKYYSSRVGCLFALPLHTYYVSKYMGACSVLIFSMFCSFNKINLYQVSWYMARISALGRHSHRIKNWRPGWATWCAWGWAHWATISKTCLLHIILHSGQ